MHPIQDVNVREMIPLLPPRQLIQEQPLSQTAAETVSEMREAVKRIMDGSDRRVMAIVGPCSIHDERKAIEYAGRLRNVAERIKDRLLVIMRVYFEKPRTTVGWKGLINDPQLDGTFDIETGLRIARRILLHITEAGLPTATEMLEPITPQYLADLITLARWPAVCPCPWVTKIARTGGCKWPSMPCWPHRPRTVFWVSIARAIRASCIPGATRGVT